MKRKTISRVAAAGLAALSAVSAMSIAASADMTTYSNGATGDSQLWFISGTASYFEWKIRYQESTINATNYIKAVPGSKHISASSASYDWNNKTYVTESNPRWDPNHGPDKYVDVDGEGSKYYMYAADANREVTRMQNEINANDNAYNTDLNKFNRELQAYVRLYNLHQDYSEAKIKNTKFHQYCVLDDGRRFDFYNADDHHNNGIFQDYSSTNSEGDFMITDYMPASINAVKFTYLNAPKVTSVPALEMAFRLSGFKVNIENNGEIVPDPNGKYQIESSGTFGGTTSSSSSTTTTTTTTTTTEPVHEESAIYAVGGTYYYTWSQAYSAAGGNTDRISYVRSYTTPGNYFSKTTGQFYSTYDAALQASGGSSAAVITITANTTTSAYDDPYYYYFLNRQNGNTANNTNNGSVKIGNRTGWTAVQNYVKSATAGTTLNVAMNNETTIPQAVLSALQGKNVTVNFTLPNGAVISYNGQNINNPRDVSASLTYNTTSVSKTLLNQAIKVNKGAVSTTQFTLNGSSMGGEAGVNIRFNSNRSGYTAKLYRYNSSRNSLQLVTTSTIGSNGRVTFGDVTQGGEYVVVVVKK